MSGIPWALVTLNGHVEIQLIIPKMRRKSVNLTGLEPKNPGPGTPRCGSATSYVLSQQPNPLGSGTNLLPDNLTGSNGSPI